MGKDEKITLLLDHCRRIDGGPDRLAVAVEAWGPSSPCHRSPPTPPTCSPSIPRVCRPRERAPIPRRSPGPRLQDRHHRHDRHGRHRQDRVGQAGRLGAPPGASATACCGPTAAAKIRRGWPTFGGGLWGAARPATILPLRAAAWRSLIAGKEALLIFDNVQPGQEIEALFPARGRSTVLITTRDAQHLALEGATWLDLNHFTLEEAQALFRFDFFISYSSHDRSWVAGPYSLR